MKTHSLRQPLAVLGLAALTALSQAAAAAVPVAARAATHGTSVRATPQATTWTGTWSAPMLDMPLVRGDGTPIALARTTVRQSLRTSIGGSAVRLRFSNLFGQQPLTLSDVHIARASSDQAIVSSSDGGVTFGGASSVTIPAGQEVSSDALTYTTLPSTDYAVSLYIASVVDASHVTAHRQAWQNIYLASGDVSASPTITPVGDPVASYLFLTGVDVVNPAAQGTLVAIGASITDGSNTSFGANRRWTNDLSLRLQVAGLTVGVLGAGLSGGHLLDDQPFGGPAGVHRFQRDVLAQSGVKWVISSDMPINDLSGHSNGNGQSDGGGPTAAQLIDGTRQLITAAHGAGVKFLCSTLTPNGGRSPNDWTPTAESIREQLNAFYRSADSGCDAIVDQDTATHDPSAPLQYRPSFNAGDSLHPNDAGTQAIANAIDLGTFEPGGLPPVAAPASCGTLLSGQGLLVNQSLPSCDGRFALVLQGDSNLVLYQGQTPLWASNTVGLDAAEFTLMPDGNAVLYSSTHAVLFQTATTGLLSTSLMLQNDGNIVVYDGPAGGPNHPLFATNTCCH